MFSRESCGLPAARCRFYDPPGASGLWTDWEHVDFVFAPDGAVAELETPPIHTILVETDDPEGPFGAKEAGQGPLLPVIPAIANAIYQAVGVRLDQVPITADMVLKGMDLKRQGKTPRIGPERIPLFTFKEPLVVESAFGQPLDAIAQRPFADQ